MRHTGGHAVCRKEKSATDDFRSKVVVAGGCTAAAATAHMRAVRHTALLRNLVSCGLR